MPPPFEPAFEGIPERGAIDLEAQGAAHHAGRSRVVDQFGRGEFVPCLRQLPGRPYAFFEFLADLFDLAAHDGRPVGFDSA